MSLPTAPSDPEADLKRIPYQLVLWVGALANGLAWSLTGFKGGYDLALPIGMAWFGGLGIALLLGWLRFYWVERLAFWGLAAYMGYNLWRNLSWFHESGLWLSTLWMGVVFVTVYMVFEIKAAWRVSVALFVMYTAIGAVVAFGTALEPLVLLQLFLSNLTYLLLMRVVLRYREYGSRMRLEASRFYELAHTDPLTGVANRRSVMEALPTELEASKRSGEPLSFILLDLDRFKFINDRFGHEAGDQVLTHVARLLMQHVRKSDVVGRWGGEEFVLMLPQTPPLVAAQLAERLQDILFSQALPDFVPVSASFGVATARPIDTVDTLVSRADKAMYQCKNAGGNRVKVATWS